MFIKCGTGNVALFATAGSAPQGILRGGVGSVNRRRPLKSRWAEQLAASMKGKISGPHASVKF